MGIKVTGIREALESIKLNKEVEKALRSRALQAFAEVKLGTPVDQGRARNSWYIGYETKYVDAGEGATSVTILEEKDKPQKIIVTNGVDYIEFLNNGHSAQAPTKFIEQIFSKYFDSVSVEVINNN